MRSSVPKDCAPLAQLRSLRGWLRPSFLLAGSLALGGGLNYAYHIALGRLLGPQLYGAFGALLGLFYLLWIFSQSVQLRLARLAALAPRFPPATLRAVLGGGVGLALGVLLLSGPLAGWLRLETPLWVALVAVVWLLTLPLPTAKGVLQGRQRFGTLALLNVLEPLVRLPLGLALVWAGAGIYGAWGAWGLAALLVLPVSLGALRTGAGRGRPTSARAPSPPTPTPGAEGADVGPAVPLLAALVLAVPTNVDVLLAKHAFPPETAGLYAAIAVLGKGFLFLALSVGAVLLPKAAGSEAGERRRHLGAALAVGLGIAALGALICAVAPQALLSRLFGGAYGEAAPWLRLYGAAMGAFTGVVLLLNYALARGRRALPATLAALSALEALILWGAARSPESLVSAFLGAQIALLGVALGLTRLAGGGGRRGRSPKEKPTKEKEPGEGGGTVAIVAPYPPPGAVHAPASGVASYTRNLVRALASAAGGPRIVVLAQKLPPSDTPDPDEEPGVVRCWTRSWGLPWQILRAVRALHPPARVVHLQHEPFLFGDGPRAALFPLLVRLLKLSRRGGARVLVTLHGVPPLGKLDREFVRDNGLRGHPTLLRWGLRALIRAAVGPADRVLVHEALFRERLVREYGIPAAKIAVIPHGVEVPSGPSARRAMPSEPDAAKRALGVAGRRTILYLGYLTGYKGVEVLLEAFARAAPAHPDWVLLLAGGPHPRRRREPAYRAYLRGLEERAARLGPQVRLLGFVPESRLPEVFCAADVVVFPYRAVLASSGPMALCAAYDRPFLASREFAGVLPEELLFPLDPEALRDRLERFFSPEGAALARKAREVARRWREERRWERVAERTWALYRSGREEPRAEPDRDGRQAGPKGTAGT